jgi:hypothetical protein
MAQEAVRSRGRPTNFKQDRGGVVSEYGPFYGVVMNNIDKARMGRIQVYIEAFADGNPQDDNKWTTVRYLPQFYGHTPANGPTATAGDFTSNPHAYGMWFTPPDVGITVLCVFVNGDRTKGYYLGSVVDEGLIHMLPAIGAENNYLPGNPNQEAYFASAALQPVTEINTGNERLDNASEYFDQAKPIHSVIASTLFQQGLARDTERGPIRSTAQRESPSSVFGVSSPGRAIYQGGLKPENIRQKLNSGEVKPGELKVIGRMGGHSLVMDDGDIDGRNQLLRLRTAKGHQITMNDTGNFFYIIHANGQTWIELGAEGTIDLYSTNSVNVRTQGDINLHADRDINMYAGRDIKMKAAQDIISEADRDHRITAQNDLRMWSKATIGVKADGTLAVQSANGSWLGGSALKFTAGGIDLNGPAAPEVTAPEPLIRTKMDDSKFNSLKGWQKVPDGLESIVTRAPAHEPYSYHNLGVDVKIEFEPGTPAPPPGAPPIPSGVNITRN